MPAAAEKKLGSRKSKKGAEKAHPPPPPLVTVRDCMVWPEPRVKGQAKGKANNKGGPPDNNPGVYRSAIVRQLDDDEGHSTMAVPSRREDGTVIEALRGWPGSREQAEEEAQQRFELERAAYLATNGDPKPGKNSSKQKKGKKEASKEELENVFIGDLIHQRYLNEHLEKRRREQEREQRKMEASASAARAGRRVTHERSNIKANRTSQLRAIALAGKVETSPLDLWKMPRFTKGVNPHLATAGGGRAALRGRPGAGQCDPYGVEACAGGCSCDHGTANYVDVSEEEILCGQDSPMATN